MKYIYILLFILLFVPAAHAQKPSGNKGTAVPVSSNKNEVPAPTNNVSFSEDELFRQMSEIKKQIDRLIVELDLKHQQFAKHPQSNQLIKADDKKVNKLFDEKEKQKNDLISKNSKLEESIKETEKQMEWVEDLRKYYMDNNLDILFLHADVAILRVHKEMFKPSDPPASLEHLTIMCESVNLLKGDPDVKTIKEYLRKLEDVKDCKTKRTIKVLLEKHSEIKKEVENWKRGDKRLLYDYMVFCLDLKAEYGFDLDKDYPYLADQARKSIELKPKK